MNRRFLRCARVWSRLLPCAAIAAVLVMHAPAAPADEIESDLRGQIERLASRHDFTVVGLERLRPAPAKPLTGDSLKRDLQTMLEDYNYLLIHAPDGGVRQVKILGYKVPAPPRYSVRTTRRGQHHIVDAVLVGPGGKRQRFPLMLDTGASIVVLPSSKIDALGFAPGDLRPGTAATANGPVAIRLGTLRQVRIGRAKVDEVAVGFIADDKIGETSLLGMSFLNHFRVTIDDSADRLTLLPR